ncbi:hypothetical protein PGTUg99_025954 [Puccinia graminis f. sp. tritici]|uniref:Uncharacterized protein n=1 Tax=Puccinia graminis f. sp. tritici TaxID=56615 RepID=A0A5B0NWN4_PUCGR|nr:hypothetical protein PGTUg99_025954 [Puccinia graminis f. sp. tritici]
MPIAGNKYTEDDVKTLVRQTNRWLLRLHKNSLQEVVDFDILAVFIMQEMDDDLHIRKLVDMLIHTFFESGKPQTTRQNQLLEAALVVQKKIQMYDDKIKSQPTLEKPYCLRYPTLEDVRAQSKLLEKQCWVLDDSRMVVLLDENDICVGIGLPPLPKSGGNPVHTPHDKKSAGMLDKKVQCTTKSIKTWLLQGYGSTWQEEENILHLPNPLRECQNTDDSDAIVKLRNEMTFYSKLSLVINTAFLPLSTKVAQEAVDYLKKQGSDRLQENLDLEKNEIVASRTVSVNTQVHTHRDRNNAFLFDSVYFFGNHLGGEFLLPSLGVAYPGLHGYSFHGPFRILYHGVAKFYFDQALEAPPQRFSVAMWSRESSFSAIARYSAYHEKDKEVSFFGSINSP